MVPPAARTIAKDRPEKVRMLVLETDETHPDTYEEKGSFGEILHDLLQKAGAEHDPQLGIETMMQYVVEDDGGRVPEPADITDDIHAILITGSEYDAHGDVKWVLKLVDLIQHIWINRLDIRFSGICFGHQVICRALGSAVEPHENGEWELSHTPIKLSDIGRSLFNLPATEEYVYLHQMHADCVAFPPSSETTCRLDTDTKVHVWGTSDHTSVQGVYIPRRLFTTQGHMEFDEKMVRRQLELRVKSGALEEGRADEATEKADWMHDGLVFAKAVLRFFHGDDDKVV
ncbi:class I glutamine amidotransferase-like protein [Massariosphaeria phaeospora]|uniref:Class I glutamine amidotransferase-like protein n=1 Tax=Massariosphaeria phaeospora TaxID=100035 RepID=A0A7C8MEL0_9PLEO|nr:class I glutamine amidotransferase-like protein [Massariosphaeria phaeospora]